MGWQDLLFWVVPQFPCIPEVDSQTERPENQEGRHEGYYGTTRYCVEPAQGEMIPALCMSDPWHQMALLWR